MFTSAGCAVPRGELRDHYWFLVNLSSTLEALQLWVTAWYTDSDRQYAQVDTSSVYDHSHVDNG